MRVGGEGVLDRGLRFLVRLAVVGRDRRGLAPHGPRQRVTDSRELDVSRRLGLGERVPHGDQRVRQLGFGGAVICNNDDGKLQ